MLSFVGIFLRHKVMPAFFAVLFLCLANAGESADYFEVSLKNVPESDYVATDSFLKVYRRLLDDILRGNQKAQSIPCRIYFVKDKGMPLLEVVELKNKSISIYLPAELSLWRYSMQIRAELTETLLCAALGVAPSKGKGRVPAWLLAGVSFTVLDSTDRDKIPGTFLAPGIHIQMDNLEYPFLASLIGSPPALDEGPVAELYGEYCALLFQAALKTATSKNNQMLALLDGSVRQSRFAPLLFYSSVGHAMAAKMLAPGSDPEPVRLDNWFCEELRRVSMNGFSPFSAAGAEKAYRQFSIISYQGKGLAESRSCSFAELAAKIPEMESPDMVMRDVQCKCAWFSYAAPDFLQASFAEIQGLLDSARNTPKDRYADKMKELEKKFFEAIGRQLRLEAWLRGVESKRIAPGIRYRLIFRELARQDFAMPPPLQAVDAWLGSISLKMR